MEIDIIISKKYQIS